MLQYNRRAAELCFDICPLLYVLLRNSHMILFMFYVVMLTVERV